MTFLTFLLAILVVEWLQRLHEESQWDAVNEHIGFHVRNVGHRCALAYRTAVGIGDQDLPRDRLSRELPEREVLEGMVEWIEGTITPSLPRLDRLTRPGWQFLMATLSEADGEAQEALLIFGTRLRPSLFNQLIEIRRAITRAKQSYELYESVLTGPGGAGFISTQMHIFDLVEIGQRHGQPTEVIIESIVEMGITDAVEMGENVLRSAVLLMQETIPLLPDVTEQRNERS